MYRVFGYIRKLVHLASIADMSLHKCRCCRSINNIFEVMSVDEREIVAYQILVEAVSHDFAGIHVREGTSFKWIPKNDLSLHINIDSIDIGHIGLTIAAICAATSALTIASPR